MNAIRSPRRRRAVALPMVMGFSFLALVFGIMMMTVRVEDKRQNLMNFQQLKAYYVAQAGVQHALLKVRILPNEVYEASALARGVCPFDPSPADGAGGTGTDLVLTEFASDILGGGSTSGVADGIPLVLAQGEETAWNYRITSVRALTTFTHTNDAADPTARKVNVLEFQAVGYVEDKLASNQRALGTPGAPGPAATAAEKRRWEQVTKIVEITRSSVGGGS